MLKHFFVDVVPIFISCANPKFPKYIGGNVLLQKYILSGNGLCIKQRTMLWSDIYEIYLYVSYYQWW